ncbi:MAG TPA: tRNA (N6-isopentenyl adenosine(37)-C2)-methylthiotransferase MiaB [Clostridiaceae bacterium]|nr:tRNA (N6-isopentenyl adenosine(37)-C2)-methylthiotransferase MiaB [Clostridiaceae bacterium]
MKNSTGDRRKDILVAQEEIARQQGIAEEIKQLNYQEEMKTGKKKLFYIETLGCQMNENDSEKLAGMLNEMGYSESDNAENSDLIIVNTCCVRENAEQKVYGHLGRYKSLKEEKPGMVIAVCGCMMQQNEVGDSIKRKYRHVDLVFGTHNLHKFPEYLYNVLSSRIRVIDIWESSGSIAEGLPITRKDGIKAWVTIMYGCNNFCSYCIVPYVRGRERSRMPEDIVREIEILGEQGYKEVTLLGQNVNSYGKDLDQNISFARLLEKINKINGIERIRFTTSHPKDLSDELIVAMRDLEKVCNHLHLPLQAGSTRILKAMNRKYTKEDYLSLTEKIKKEIPDIALSTDIIVGFPGETEEDFNDTIDVVEKVRFDSAYTFLYSKRKGTPAAKNPEQVEEEVKKRRFGRLLEVQNKISRELNEKLLNKVEEILVEGISKNNPHVYTGRTRTNKIVNFQGDSSMVGRIIKVKINKIQTWSLEGTVVPAGDNK